jgi:hypothetical protein
MKVKVVWESFSYRRWWMMGAADSEAIRAGALDDADVRWRGRDEVEEKEQGARSRGSKR